MKHVFPALFLAAATTTLYAASDDALRIVSQHYAVWDAPPQRTPADHSVDGPLMGNGDMLVAVGGPPEEQQFHLSKNDLWRLGGTSGGNSPVGFGRLSIRIPDLAGASYTVKQFWADPKTEGTFRHDDLAVRMKTVLGATRNLLLIEIEAEGGTVEAEAVLEVASGRGSISIAEHRDGAVVGQRSFERDVALPSGVAVAWKILGAEMVASTPRDSVPKTATHRVQLGREQFGGGRWGFKGSVDDLRLYERVLGEQEMGALVEGKAPGGAAQVWKMDRAAPGGEIRCVPGKVGGAWRFSGDPACYFDGGDMTLPVEPVTVACWIRIDDTDPVANYILSCGEWKHGISLGLSAGKLRFTAHGTYVESSVLPKDEWIHVGGTWDGSQHVAYLNGKVVASAGHPPPRAGVRFALGPGQPVTLVLAMDSVFKSPEYVASAFRALSDVSNPSGLAEIRAEHAAWWADYWSRSYVEIDDRAIEQAYYRSLYHMGACSRDPRFPPGIFGWVTTDKPKWSGDYHLNYNHMAPFYALYSANRLAQGDPEDAPILDFRPIAAEYARRLLDRPGVLYPVGVAARGVAHGNPVTFAGRNIFWGQKSNGLYCLVNMAQRWRCTYDVDYGRKIYPLVRDVIDFWEADLVWEDEGRRYRIVNDSVHEGSGTDLNPILTLGLLRNGLDLVLDLSTELKVDTDRRAKWRHLLGHLSTWTTQEREGKTVFRYTEIGTPWWRDNTLGIQHIYPGNALGLDSEPKWLTVAHNTVEVMDRWIDFNGSNSFFPAAVRVGYDPKIILDQLGRYVASTYPNGFMKENPHGIENYSTTPNTINEMLCMSHVPVSGPGRAESVLRVFPVWPKDRDARFTNIRAWGAFLVSGALQGGTVRNVTILSERGRDCTVVNPWPAKNVQLIRDGRKAEVLHGERFTFPTGVAELCELMQMP